MGVKKYMTVKTTIEIKSWESPCKVWGHGHMLFLKGGGYEVGKRRLRMTKLPVPPDVYESGSKGFILVFSEYMVAEHFFLSIGIIFLKKVVITCFLFSTCKLNWGDSRNIFIWHFYQ